MRASSCSGPCRSSGVGLESNDMKEVRSGPMVSRAAGCCGTIERSGEWSCHYNGFKR